MKTSNLNHLRATLLALVAGFSLFATLPSRAEGTPAVQTPPPPAPAVNAAIRVAWDRVGSQERSVV